MASLGVESQSTHFQAQSSMNLNSTSTRQFQQSKIPRPLRLVRKGNSHPQNYSPRSFRNWHQPGFLKSHHQTQINKIVPGKLNNVRVSLPRKNDDKIAKPLSGIPKLQVKRCILRQQSLPAAPIILPSERRQSRIPVPKRTFQDELDFFGRLPSATEDAINILEAREVKLVSVLFKIRQKIDQLKEQRDVGDVLVAREDQTVSPQLLVKKEGESPNHPLLGSPSAVYVRPPKKRVFP